jgi:AraC family transcriptional regulator
MSGLKSSSLRFSNKKNEKKEAHPIMTECAWRQLDMAAGSEASMEGKIVMGRWKNSADTYGDFISNTDEKYHIIEVALRTTRLTLRYADRPIYSGLVMPGATQVTSPGNKVCAQFEDACDMLHFFVPQTVLTNCYYDALGTHHNGTVTLCDPALVIDVDIDRLSRAILSAADSCGPFCIVYADSLALAIVARILARQLGIRRKSSPMRISGLASWRVNRALEYIDAHLDKDIRLCDIAESAGLSMMHFAAQFRAATGIRPHEFLQRRRIERAQDLLINSDLNLPSVALLTGFRTQAHFTTVFKRWVGVTPARWKVQVAQTRS